MLIHFLSAHSIWSLKGINKAVGAAFCNTDEYNLWNTEYKITEDKIDNKELSLVNTVWNWRSSWAKKNDHTDQGDKRGDRHQ